MNKLNIIFYITQYNQVKDATQFYLEIISEALSGSKELKMTDNIGEILNVDYAITFTVTDFFRLKTRKPSIKIIHWFQGIIPEEATLKGNSKIQYFAFSLLERFTLKFSAFNFFVSQEMKKHYHKKYSYRKENYFVMPCFNGEIFSQKTFLNKEFLTPNFVYIGSISTWQSVDILLEVFKIVQTKIPSATLTILTGQAEKAKIKCNKYNVEANISYVPVDKISEELLNYKYGFLIRENNIVNQVATPTKMSTYLASGVIPIYTHVMKAFDSFNELKYQIKVKQLSPSKIAEEIIEFEKTPIDNANVYEEYLNVFNTFYNKDEYISSLRQIFKIE